MKWDGWMVGLPGSGSIWFIMWLFWGCHKWGRCYWRFPGNEGWLSDAVTAVRSVMHAQSWAHTLWKCGCSFITTGEQRNVQMWSLKSAERRSWWLLQESRDTQDQAVCDCKLDCGSCPLWDSLHAVLTESQEAPGHAEHKNGWNYRHSSATSSFSPALCQWLEPGDTWLYPGRSYTQADWVTRLCYCLV